MSKALQPTKAGQRAKHSFVDDAYRQIKQKILDNDMPPGFQALEAELALQFGMSRTPIREALLRLQGEGFVRLAPRRGMMVLPISPDDMREIYDVITALETVAAEGAASRALSLAEIAELDGAVDAMDAALKNDDLDAWADADDHFHLTVLRLCGNSRLAATSMMFRDQIRRTRMLTLRLRPRPDRSNEAHRKLVAAIRAGDAEAAFHIHREQRRRASVELTEILKRYRLNFL